MTNFGTDSPRLNGHEENHDHTGDEGEVAVEEGKPKLKEPPRFAVLLHNDDYTTMDFVIEVLRRFFQKSYEEAYEVTMKVHREGRGVAGVYSHQIAETKSAQVMELAQSRGFPLRSSVEPA
jgi:ATP-dependent Clp protease adaptor protein ClpS